jgi:hypothetical protein
MDRLDVLMGLLPWCWMAAGANVALADYGPVIASACRMRIWLFALASLVLIGVTHQTLGPYVSRPWTAVRGRDTAR